MTTTTAARSVRTDAALVAELAGKVGNAARVAKGAATDLYNYPAGLMGAAADLIALVKEIDAAARRMDDVALQSQRAQVERAATLAAWESEIRESVTP